MKKYGQSDGEIKQFAYDVFCGLDGMCLPVFLCVGCDKYVCDSLAPIIAEILRKKYNIRAYVYGGLDYNINATNLMSAIHYIETEHPYSQIVLIDATLGDDVGSIILTDGSYAGMGRILPIRKLGDFSILGVVAKKAKELHLNITKMKIVSDLAHSIAKGIAMAMSVFSTKIGQKFTQNLKYYEKNL